ncbi:MAG: precorrin-6y C5,15-methyltransferase (decarboxylating) subunit CbiE [Alphaproteobacteria bacterium]|nr:precorrin-6y C5,15-methyltransferase (decarboxylating) subunit CbiE [Alphaproteobacteria bacterium]
MSHRQVNDPTASVGAPVWLSVIGIGDDGLASIGPRARAVIEVADVVFGGVRHLEMIPDHPGERRPWRQPLEHSLDDIEALRPEGLGGKKVVVLASGDPMCFGVGALIAKRFAGDEIQMLPVASAFSLACARLGWALQDVETLSLHNRPPSTLRRYLQPGARLVALTRDGDTPHLVASLLVEMGFGPSHIHVFEHLGGTNERRVDATAERWAAKDITALNTVAIECIAGPSARVFAGAPGLPDDAFASDGMLTRREIRALTLARLMPFPGQCLWDVGAGSGAVAIEWLRSARRGRAIAIERDKARALRAASNAEALGTPELDVVEAEAPTCFDRLAAPDAIFIGGGITAPDMLSQAWRRLAPGGRLVANVVTLEGERKLMDWQAEHGGDLVRLAISRAEKVGPYQGWRPAMPITQYAGVKS